MIVSEEKQSGVGSAYLDHFVFASLKKCDTFNKASVQQGAKKQDYFLSFGLKRKMSVFLMEIVGYSSCKAALLQSMEERNYHLKP